MNIEKLIAKTNVPEGLRAEALQALNSAERAARGLLWAKWKVRLFKAGKIAKMMTWENERLLDVRPDLLDWDVAPMINITAHGDNVPWNPATGRPEPGQWLNKDPDSEEYKQAVAANYWCPGEHPRSDKSHKAQYRRNAGEGRAYRLGLPVDLSAGRDAAQVYRSADGAVVLIRCGQAWQLKAERRLVGRLGLKTRVGYEIDNIWRESDGAQCWYPIPGYELRAPLTWSVLPGKVS